MRQELAVAVAGMGFTGRQHVEAIRRIPGLSVVAIADGNADVLQAQADVLGIERTFSSVSEMMVQCPFDVLHNCTPNAYHAELNRQALAKGRHVFCEKPLATLLADAEALVALAKKQQVAAGVNFNYRGNAMVQEMAQRVQQDETGHPLLAHGHYLQDWLMKDTDYSWRLEEALGGKSRAVADIGSHWFDTAQFVLGRRITRVFARLFTAYETRYKPLADMPTFVSSQGAPTQAVPITSEDGGMILLEFEGGLPGSLLLSQVSGGYKNALELCVSAAEGSLRWEQEQPDKLFVGTRRATEIVTCAPDTVHSAVSRYATLPAGHVTAWSDALRNNIKEFYQSIWTGIASNPMQTYATFADATAIMRIVEGCMESHRENRWVDINR